MDMKERILEYMEREAYRPLDAADLLEGMQVGADEQGDFFVALDELEDDAYVVKNRAELYGLPHKMHLVVGRLSMTAKGFGFVIPERGAEDGDVFIPAGDLLQAMHGDRVIARVLPTVQEGCSREGEILRVVERVNGRIVGTFERSRSFGFVTPDNAKLGQDIFVPKKCFSGAKTGSKVVVEIDRWPSRHHSAEGHIAEVLGKIGEPGVDILSVMRAYDLSEEFPARVQKIADHVEQQPEKSDYAGRKDCREELIVTIDGDDAKDLDDAVAVRKNADGNYFLGVYIADVSHYVRENEPLDREARARGTSVYLVDRVIPMLPKELSNGICSLNAGEDRLAMACEMQISPEGKVLHYEILPAVIHVYRRLTYKLVNKLLVDKEEEIVRDNADILPMMEALAELRHCLKAKRRARGSIDFDLPEIQVKLDEEGHPTALVKRTGSLAESMIEECMLVANETVAEHMQTRNQPFLYRVHERPTDEKLERLNSLLTPFGLYVRENAEREVQPADIQTVLSKVEGRPEERLISSVALRSMQQARYGAEPLGHFGLSAKYYTHFTSPIRRYPDLIVHRLLREQFETGDISGERAAKLRRMLPEIAEHSSMRERIAVEAERETTDLKKIEYMAGFVGESFDAVISGVTAFGIFVELDNGVEGLVHVSTMANDYYSYVEAEYAMVGQRTNEKYRLGDAVQVILIRANVEERNLDFVLSENRAYDVDGRPLARLKGAKAQKPMERRKEREERDEVTEILARMEEDIIVDLSESQDENPLREEVLQEESEAEKARRKKRRDRRKRSKERDREAKRMAQEGAAAPQAKDAGDLEASEDPQESPVRLPREKADRKQGRREKGTAGLPSAEEEVAALMEETSERAKKQKRRRRRKRKEQGGAVLEAELAAEQKVDALFAPALEEAGLKPARAPKLQDLKKETAVVKGGKEESFRKKRENAGRERGRERERKSFVTGLNSAVWPDPPGYHEQKQRAEQAQAQAAESRRPRPFRKTEGGTANSK